MYILAELKQPNINGLFSIFNQISEAFIKKGIKIKNIYTPFHEEIKESDFYNIIKEFDVNIYDMLKTEKEVKDIIEQVEKEPELTVVVLFPHLYKQIIEEVKPKEDTNKKKENDNTTEETKANTINTSNDTNNSNNNNNNNNIDNKKIKKTIVMLLDVLEKSKSDNVVDAITCLLKEIKG